MAKKFQKDMKAESGMKVILLFIDCGDPESFFCSQEFIELVSALDDFNLVDFEARFLDSSDKMPEIPGDPQSDLFFVIRRNKFYPRANSLAENIRSRLIKQGCCHKWIIFHFQQQFSLVTSFSCPYH